MEHTPYTEDDPTITTPTTSSSPHSSGETHLKSNPQPGGGTRHPVYRGVRKRRWGKWVSEIREPRKKSRIWLGSFPVPEMAAKAYDVAAYCLKGRKAQLNFPDELEHLPRPSSCTARDIQAAAAKAAHMKRSVNSKKNDVLEDSGGDGDDFWGEIELPELINNGCYWNSCGWTTMSSSSSSSIAGGGDASSWPDGDSTQPFMACL